MLGLASFVAFLSAMPIANWLIKNVGVTCVPNGPCLIPVWPGIMSPSGVLVIGLAFVARDFLQREWGPRWALAAIALGAVISGMISPPALVVASAAAFALSELSDFAVYTPLRKRGFALAVAASSVVGLMVDSVLFLWLAFGSLDHIEGQIIGKMWMVLAASLLIYGSHRAAARATV